MNAKHIVLSGACVLAWAGAVYAQSPTPTPSATPTDCTFQIYRTSDLDQKAKVSRGPAPNFNDEEIQKYRGSLLVARGLLCGSGKVTDVGMIRGVSGANIINEKFLEAIRGVKFTPAKKHGQIVSQWFQFEFHFR